MKNLSEHLIWAGYMVIPETMHGDQEAWMPSLLRYLLAVVTQAFSQSSRTTTEN